MSISRDRPIRRLSRSYLRPLGKLLPLTVRRGPLKGRRLLTVSPMRFFRGTYEPEQTALFASLLKPGDVLYDVGAHVGWHTLIASPLVGSDGHVVAFEPQPENGWILQRHLQLNGLTNVTLMKVAAAETSGTALFDPGSGTGTGSLSREGKVQVETARVDELVRDESIPPPSLMKIDVEGGEDQVVAGAIETIAKHRPTILLHTHGTEQWERCRAFLLPLGYRQPRPEVAALYVAR